MALSICGIDCSTCELKSTCCGCSESGGRPFGESCVAAEYCKKGGNAYGEFKQKLIDSFNSLGIKDMPVVTSLNELKGSYINMVFALPNGEQVKFWNDNRIYLGNLIPKNDSGRFFGLAADEKYLMVCECSLDDSCAELIVFRQLEL